MGATAGGEAARAERRWGWSYRGRHRLATLAVWLPMPLVALVLLVLLMTAFGS